MSSPPIANRDASRERRYLLGQLSEDERTALELEYLASDGLVEQVAAVEEDLIEEYLDGELGAEDRASFEREYLSSPARLARLGTIRRLQNAARVNSRVTHAASGSTTWQGWRWQLPAAAAAIVAIGLAVWLTRPREAGRDASLTTPPAAPSTEPPAPAPESATSRQPPTPRVLAVTLSSIAQRSTTGSDATVVPKDVDMLALTLEGQSTGGPLRAEIATVGGQRVWQGDAAMSTVPGAAAIVEVPAAQLPPDDYVVTLFRLTAAGTEREAYRYVLRIRAG